MIFKEPLLEQLVQLTISDRLVINELLMRVADIKEYKEIKEQLKGFYDKNNKD